MRPLGEQRQAKLLASLWGNRAGLGFRIGASAGLPATDRLIADDSPGLWAALGPGGRVVLATDNAGRELLADLVLADHLLHHGLAGAVTLQVKPWPYYVSDAVAADVVTCLRRLAGTLRSPRGAAAGVHSATADGRLRLGTHEFYCAVGLPAHARRRPARRSPRRCPTSPGRWRSCGRSRATWSPG